MKRSRLNTAWIGMLSLSLALLFILGGCGSTKRYRPVVKYAHPSDTALEKILRGTYGKRYRYAGQGPNRFDCSGLVYYSYATMNLWLPRKAIDQSRYGRAISARDLRFGDLIFFDTRKHSRGIVSHVGIYLSHGKFFHASSAKRRVIVSSLHKPYYQQRIVAYRRVYAHWRHRAPAPSHRTKNPEQQTTPVSRRRRRLPSSAHPGKDYAAENTRTTAYASTQTPQTDTVVPTAYSAQTNNAIERIGADDTGSTVHDTQSGQSLY
ncbi:MAG TPA: NlpC/P60 family protein [Epsilonproteobacteria bacterium]|nr:NlpC/P60 family protein [Campylobacterota bacterium]